MVLQDSPPPLVLRGGPPSVVTGPPRLLRHWSSEMVVQDSPLLSSVDRSSDGCYIDKNGMSSILTGIMEKAAKRCVFPDYLCAGAQCIEAKAILVGVIEYKCGPTLLNWSMRRVK
ncbi:hypothetical protein chiPu_0008201 [Chiloscyllium punctatum]|uniref:Uncharacterized protein n=1 Tax=Chiloscyllium punctatum TaxID=137246 RepID=A0A401SH69_CHIPU|nr:hypothetical protein [Chiloscyllium punctatum]